MTQQFKTILAIALAGTLAGCAVGPDYQRMTPSQIAPEQFSGTVPNSDQNYATEPVTWWSDFHDPGLDALVQVALQHSPDIDVAQANIQQARAGAAQAESARSLQLNGEARVGRDQFSKDSENFANIPFANPQTGFNDYRGGFDASWEIDLFGHTSRSIESAWAKAGGVQAQRDDVALSIAAETARNVLDYRYLQLRLASAKAVVNDSLELLRLTRLQRDAGLASDIDVQQASVAVDNAQTVLPQVDVAIQMTVNALIPLTGLTRQAVVAQLAESRGEPRLPEAGQFAISSAVLERRPDIRIAERKLASANADVGVAMANRYPRFTLVGDAGWDSIHPGQFGQQASRYWSVGPQLYVPILNGGQVQAAIDQSQAARDAALAGYRKAVLAALADTESAMLRCQGDHAQLARIDAAYLLQSGQITLTQKRVDAGEAPQIDLLNSRIQREDTAGRQLATRQAMAEDLVLLFKALGGTNAAQ